MAQDLLDRRAERAADRSRARLRRLLRKPPEPGAVIGNDEADRRRSGRRIEQAHDRIVALVTPVTEAEPFSRARP